jgi:two-component system response regulator NreC
MKNKLRILLAEDHETVRAGLRLLINEQPDMEVVGEASNGRVAVERARELQPDVLVMDISMPDMNGLKATAKLQKICPHIKLLTLTRHTDDGYLQELLRAGVSGYVLKQSTSAELLRAVRTVAAGDKYLDPAITSKVIGGYAGRQIKAGGESSLATLSARESDVLRQIAWGYSNKEIAAQLSLSVKTVEAHKANAMRKMSMRSRIDIVRYAILQGWLEEN